MYVPVLSLEAVAECCALVHAALSSRVSLGASGQEFRAWEGQCEWHSSCHLIKSSEAERSGPLTSVGIEELFGLRSLSLECYINELNIY